MSDSSGSIPRLAGRDPQQQAIRAALAGAAAGDGAALLFHGDLGIGKTALLAYAADQAAGFAVVRIGADPAEAGLPFAVLHRLLTVLGAGPAGPVTERSRALLGVVERGCPDGDLFGLYVAFLDLLRSAAGERPVLCCVDDAHWLDRPSWHALTFAARRLRGERIAMLFAHRDEAYPVEAHPDEAHRDEAHRDEARPAGPAGGPIAGIAVCRVGPLDEGASRALLRDLVPAADVAAAVAVTAAGNPQALLDLAAALTPEQRRGAEPVTLTLPAGSRLRQAYRAQLARLPAATRRLVLLAATDEQATGEHLDVDTLVRATRGGDAGVTALAPAEASGLVRVDGAAVTFPQPLARSVVYEEAALAERRSAHADLARALDPDAEPLRHCLHAAATAPAPDEALAGRLERAAGTCGGNHAAASRAMQRAAELSADRPDAALRLIGAARHAWRAGEPHRARMLLRQVPPAVDGARVRARWEVLVGEIELRTGETGAALDRLLAAADTLAERDRHLAVGALIRAGDAMSLAGDYGRYSDLADRALALRRPDDPADAQFIFEHLTGLSATFRGEHDRAAAPLRRSLALAATLDEAGALTRASLAALVLGDEAHAHRLATRAAGVARRQGEVSAVPQALEFAALAEVVMGRPGAATTGLEGLRLATDSGQESLVGTHLATLALGAANVGDRPASLSRVRQARALPVARDVGRSRALSEWALAVLDLTDGQYAAALARLRAMARAGPAHGHLIVKVATTPHLVEAAVRCGEHALAARALATFDAWAGSTGNPHWLALSARCHALLAPAATDAEEYFRESLRRHQLSPAELDRARTQLLFGRWLRRRRRPAAAREPLRDALETFERFGARPWVEQVAAELRAAGETVGRSAAPATDGLTPHQLQIARLVADGATNREVAAQMRVSCRTVDHHLRNIFARLGVRSRVELSKIMR